jgi:hypothetical protein
MSYAKHKIRCRGAEATILLSILQVSGSNISPETGYIMTGLSLWFSSVPSGKF